jgi:hypothetical protein
MVCCSCCDDPVIIACHVQTVLIIMLRLSSCRRECQRRERRRWRAQAVASAGSGSNASAANGSEVNIRVFCVIRFRFRFRFRFRCGAGYQDNVRGRFSIACTHKKHLHVGAHCITSPLPLTCPLFGCVFSSLASLEFTGFGA